MLHYWADIARDWSPILQCVAFLLGIFALYKWSRERNDRATDVLLKLEEHFNVERVRKGRFVVEDINQYNAVSESLISLPQRGDVSDDHQNLDDLLRFYVVLCAVRQAGQVPDRALSTCYRFWLSHYYLKNRTALRNYINGSFPTLRDWLIEDASRYRRRDGRLRRWLRPAFFTPDHFWDTSEFELNQRFLDPRHGDR